MGHEAVKRGVRGALIVSAGAVLLGYLLWHRCGLHGCPKVDQLNAYQPGGQSALYDARGHKFADLAPVQHSFVSIDSLPAYVPDAVVAIEDKRFYQHHGVDYRRVLGSLAADIKSRSFAQGFSTITMQIAGSVWRDRVKRTNKTIGRKLVEVRIAREIEHKFSKKEILELYLNNIYFGAGAYGIEAASQVYFRKHARDLTLPEAALLATLPKSPTIYDPRVSSSRALKRRNLVLGVMAAQGKITAQQADRAKGAPLAVRRDRPPRRNGTQTAPYFAEAVRRVLENHFGEDLYTMPLRVYTTLDVRVERAAEEELSRQLRLVEGGAFGRFKATRYSSKSPVLDETPYIQGAVLVMDAHTGAVRAHVGGRDFNHSQFDRVTRAHRQAGSAFKPFVYATAIAEGYAPTQLIKDTPLKMELPGGEVWEPKNFTQDFDSVSTLRDALVQSKNIPTIRLAADVGLSDIARTARHSGIGSSIPQTPAMAIGTASVTPLELTDAYTVFATLGKNVQPRWIDRVEDEDGTVVWRPDVVSNRVLDQGVAYLVTDMLRDAVNHGTGTAVRRAGFTRPAAGKTGTTNDGTDTWFVGYTPDIVAGVWIGFDDPQPIVKDASGGRIAAPVWGRMMRRIYAPGDSMHTWPRPASVVTERFDPTTGLLLQKGCRPRIGSADTELFLKYSEPASTCPRGTPEHKTTIFDRAISWLRHVWHEFGNWIAEHIGREKAPKPAKRERYLGIPKLPESVDVDTTTMPEIQRGIDTTKVKLMPVNPETIYTETPQDMATPDTINADTLRRPE